MTFFRQIYKSLTYRRAFCLVLVVAYLVRSVLAQDLEVTEEPAPVTTEVPIQETAIPTEVLLLPTEITPSLEPTLLPPAPTTLPPTPIVAEPAILATEVLPTPILIEPTSLPTILPSWASLVITTSTTRLAQAAVVSVSITAENLSNPEQFVLTCQVDPNILHGILAVPGDQVIVSNADFQINGQWQMTGKYLNFAAELPNPRTVWSLNYEGVGLGFTSLLCWLQPLDVSGQLLPLTIPSEGLTIEVYPSEIPASPLAIVATAAPAPEVFVTVPTFQLSGQVESLFPLGQVAITLIGTTLQTTTTASDGMFALDVPTGQYQLTIIAPQHLPSVFKISVLEQALTLPTIMLTGGDADGNTIINSADTDAIIANYGLLVPPAPSSVDMNSDGRINLYDLTLVSANIRHYEEP